MKIFFKTILILPLIAFAGCKDYLDENPLTDVSIDFLYNSPAGIKTGIVGLYDINRNIYSIGPNENSQTLFMYALHDLVVPRSGYISVIGKFAQSAFDPTAYGATFTQRIWRHHYKIIDRANALIVAAEKVEGMDEGERLKAIGEARLFRAHSLFMLWQMFKNVYVKTEPTTPENVFIRVEQPSSKEEIFAQLHEDFDFAIANLPWKDEPGRMTQALARHLKAKAALWEEDWQTAAEQAEAVINSGYYNLLSNPASIFSGDRNSAEALFVIQLAEGVAGGGPTNLIPANFMTRYDKVVGAKYSLEQGGRGFGFIYPNKYLLGLYDSFDKRLSAYYITKFYYNDEENLPPGVALGNQIAIADKATYYERIHPSCKKYFDDDIPPEAALSYKNILIYRLAETHIVAAEAYMRMGNQAKALEMINPLRERADVPPIFNLTELELMKEHARELAFEGQRFFFLKRIGKLVDQVQRFSGDNDYANDARANIRPHYVNLPIPQDELNLLGPNYPQNDGY